MFLKPEDLKNVRVSSLLSLVANTGLGLISYPHGPARRHNGTVMIYMSLGSLKEPLAYVYCYYYYYIYVPCCDCDIIQ
jgi:hypothetical protein